MKNIKQEQTQRHIESLGTMVDWLESFYATQYKRFHSGICVTKHDAEALRLLFSLVCKQRCEWTVATQNNDQPDDQQGEKCPHCKGLLEWNSMFESWYCSHCDVTIEDFELEDAKTDDQQGEV